MDRDILIALLAQIPIAIYTIVMGIANFRTNTRKMQADAELSLGEALHGAGETLEDAWLEIRNVRSELKETRDLLDQERAARQKIGRDMNRWINYAAHLKLQVLGAGLEPYPFPPDTDELKKSVESKE